MSRQKKDMVSTERREARRENARKMRVSGRGVKALQAEREARDRASKHG